MQLARNELMAALEEVGPDDWSRYVPYGDRTLHELLAHLAGADHAWALAAQGLLKGEGADQPPISPEEADAAKHRAIERGRSRTSQALIEEMQRRRQLVISLFELLEPRHLALPLRSFGERHNSVRERIWLGYHDRMHAADIRRALTMHWQPQDLRLLPELQPAVDALAPRETLYVAYSVDPVRWEQPSGVPGWTYRLLLAHIATGDWVLQHHLRHIIEHGSVAPWPDVDAGNAERVAERRASIDRRLVEEYLSMRHETMRLLARVEREHLALPIEFRWEPRPNQHTVLEYLLAFERHDRTHRDQLRPAMRYLR